MTKNFALIPDVRMFWQHEYLNGSRNIGASLAADDVAGFGYQTTGLDQDAVYGAVGLIAQIGRHWNANVYYNTDFGRGDFISHAINGGVGFSF